MSQSKKDAYLKAQGKIADLLFGDDEDEEEEEEEAAPKKKKKGKKEKPAKKKKGRKAKDEEEEEGPTLNAVRKAMRTFSSDFGKDEAKALLEPYDVTSLSALDEDDYQSLLDDIETASEED